MQAISRDDILFKLSTTAEFYGKTIESNIGRMWLKALRGHPIESVLDAFDEHVQSGKYMPKPVDILGIIGKSEAQSAANTQPKPDDPIPCPKILHDAWTWFIGMYTENSKIGRMFADRGVDDEKADEYLLLVNQEAKRANLPDAIPNEYKISEVWT